VRQLTGATVWLTGLSGAGKSTIASNLADIARDRDVDCFVLDGDVIRGGLNADLGFSEHDRAENVRRIGEVALLIARSGHLVVVAAISPRTKDRDAVRIRHDELAVHFAEVYVATRLEVCEHRDVKGLYALARSGKIEHFTGISDPYEPPCSPDMTLSSEEASAHACAEVVANYLESIGAIPPN
jgi:adenylyl-sulfate kinase